MHREHRESPHPRTAARGKQTHGRFHTLPANGLRWRSDRKTCCLSLLWSVNSYLASFRSTPFHMTPFLAPAPEGPLVFTSPHSLPSLAFPLPWACGLPCSVLVGASSVRGISATSRLVPVRCFAFPVRRENIIANSLIVSQYKFAYSIITR